MDTGSEGKDEIKTHYVSAINRHDEVRSCKFGEKQQDGRKNQPQQLQLTLTEHLVGSWHDVKFFKNYYVHMVKKYQNSIKNFRLILDS